MEIILIKDFKGLGYKNDTVNVKDGYGRNYLIPKGFALVATQQNKKINEENIRQGAHKVAKQKHEAELIADKLRQIIIKIKAKVGEKNKIFGSITQLQVVEALKEQTAYIADKKDISFERPAKTLGLHKATIKIHKEVVLPLQYEVIAQE